MARRKRDWRDGIGRPSAVVLFRAADKWRFAIYGIGGVLAGGLPDEPVTGTAESARQAMHRWIEEAFEITAEVAWTAADEPEWWTGQVADTGT